LLANGDEFNLILLSFVRPLSFLFIRLFGTSIKKYCLKKAVNIFVLMFATFSPQKITGLDAGLNGKI